ncbi:choice-of-anchor G family protein [Jiangella gansuensis]|uniref:choice-of-anchor G family protein n=1 Tax=Jiangella gansuensis TaxID=281473 RepID=UPI00146F94B7|nr:choice-of-anchor G family protein [Jiangella gansuensis]
MPATPVMRRRRAATTLLAAGLAPVFAVGAWLTPAAAAEGDESRAGARFLDGVVLGTDLDQIAELAGVEVENLGDPEPVTEANPLDVTLLDSINIDIEGGVQLPLSDIIELGAVNQWATAEDGATSHAATGAVADNGGVGTGVDAGFPGNATFDLTDLLGEGLTDLIADVELELGAVSSEAHLQPVGDDFEVVRDYEIAGGRLVITVPLLSGLNLELGDDAAVWIENGSIVIDLDAVFESLNDLPPNSELIGPGLFNILDSLLAELLGELGSGLGDLLGNLGLDGLLDGLGEALADILSVKVNVQPDIAETTAATPATARVANDVQAASTSETYSVAAVQVTLLGGLDNGGVELTLAESHVGPNTLDEGQETEVDGTETEVDGVEVDGVEVDGVEVDGVEVDGTEVDGVEVDGVEVDGTEVDGTEVDGTEVDGTEVDGTEVDGTEVDGTEVDGTETDGTETDGTETDGEELPDTGAGSSQLLILGLGLMFAGGIAAYAVTRRRGLVQE